MKLLHYFTISACIILLIASPIGFYNALKQYSHVQETKQWSTAEAQIIQSKIRIEEDAGTSYIPDIEYTYSVNGKEYKNSQILLYKQVQFGKESLAKEFTERYPVDSKQIIYYNKEKPTESVLESGTNIRHLFDFVLPVFCFGLGIALFYIMFIKDRKKKDEDEEGSELSDSNEIADAS